MGIGGADGSDRLLVSRVLGISLPPRELSFDEASVLHFPGDSGLAGRYQGGDAIVGLLRHLAGLTDGTLEFTNVRVIAAAASGLAMLGRLRGRRPGGWLDTVTVHLFKCDAGTVREAWLFYHDQHDVDRFWEARLNGHS
ncbi:MAG: hypothetical protein QNJ81_12070 [Acidimicrobiia bacterium]|nr:hypothetical protein [Acidimicrobiia bacterium]